MRRLLYLLLPFLVVSVVFSQVEIKGKVTDSETGKPIIGASVLLEGTFMGAATDASGNYVIYRVPSGKYTIRVSSVGYETIRREITVGTTPLELNFTLKPTTIQLGEVIVQAERPKERETPVAFTVVTRDEFITKFNAQDVTLLLKRVPGVYVFPVDAVGNGESRMYVRGFDQTRFLLTINGIPENDPESKAIYWSNWGSVSANASRLQVQRGASSALYGSGAFGGSFDISTMDAPPTRSYELRLGFGSPYLLRYGVAFNSGLIMDGKLAFSIQLEKKTGEGRIGNVYDGINYYFAASFFPNPKHSFKLVLHGAPQLHSYAWSARVEFFEKYGYNANPTWFFPKDKAPSWINVSEIEKNDNLGIVTSKYVGIAHNYYHKPQLELHHTWYIDQNSRLRTTLFYTIGRGGGSSVNFLNGRYYNALYSEYVRDSKGVLQNPEVLKNGGIFHRASQSFHRQYGIISNYQREFPGFVRLTLGFEARSWYAEHPGYVVDTYGGQPYLYWSYKDSQGKIRSFRRYLKQGRPQGTSVLNVFGWKRVENHDAMYRDYVGEKPQFTIYGSATWFLLENRLNILTAIQYRHIKYHIFEYMPSENAIGELIGIDSDKDGKDDNTGQAIPAEYVKIYKDQGHTAHRVGSNKFLMYGTRGEVVLFDLLDLTRTSNFIQPKIGVNYNLTPNFNVFANYSLVKNEPALGVFYNRGRPLKTAKDEVSNQIEFGFGYLASGINAKLNLYQITWENRARYYRDPSKAGQPGYDRNGGRTDLVGSSRNRGVEFEGGLKFGAFFKGVLGTSLGLLDNLSLNFSFTYFDHVWTKIADEVKDLYFGKNYQTGEVLYFKDLKGKHVRSGPQTMVFFNIRYTYSRFIFDIDIYHHARDYAQDGELPVKIKEGDPSTTDDDEWSVTLPSRTIVDVSAAVNFRFGFLKGMFSVQVNNLFDVKHFVSADRYGLIPGPTRVIRANLNLSI